MFDGTPVSAAQLHLLRSLKDPSGHELESNGRPLQPLNLRTVRVFNPAGKAAALGSSRGISKVGAAAVTLMTLLVLFLMALASFVVFKRKLYLPRAAAPKTLPSAPQAPTPNTVEKGSFVIGSNDVEMTEKPRP